jgi:hypothetical protein
MSRISHFAALALAGAVIAVTAYASQPGTASAQSQAEQSCADRGVQPRSTAWELCLSHVTRAYEWGERGLAKQLARAAGDAQVNCLARGQRTESADYKACVNDEIEAHSDLLILGDDQSGVGVAQAQQ